MQRCLFVLALAALAAGCAKSPDAIAPAYVSQNLYQSLDCGQLTEEQAALQAALSVASQQQSNARSNDIVGIVLLGLPVSTLSGDNIAHQLADLKGHSRAVQQTMIRNRCSGRTAHAAAPVAGYSRATTPAYAPAPVPGYAPAATGGDARVGAAVGRVNAPAGVRPLPAGPGVAQAVNYSPDEILVFCRAGWETRQLNNGTIQYNPCYYQ